MIYYRRRGEIDMNKTFSILNIYGDDEETLKEVYDEDLQVMFAENFFDYPERYTFKGLTIPIMIELGMIDELDNRILEEAIRQWDENQQEIYGVWEEESLDSRVDYFEDIATNWR